MVSQELRDGVQKLVEKLSSLDDPANPPKPTTVVVTMTGPQTSEAKCDKFSVVSDEPTSVGGTDTAPPPSSIFVASIGFAENVIFARQAALQDIDFDALETKVEAQWDRRGMFGIRDADPSISNVMIETRIATGASPEKIAELVRLTHKRCPMTATVAKAATIRRRLFVNGLETPV
ncbi:MAG: OsmC family protein [Thaumarchaeota archaeon]|nr:OsmC family protein [Nitrososphaerota archaeon]